MSSWACAPANMVRPLHTIPLTPSAYTLVTELMTHFTQHISMHATHLTCLHLLRSASCACIYRAA